MTARRVGVERIFSWSALDEKTRVGVLVCIFLMVAIAPAIGQSVESGWDVRESGTDQNLNTAIIVEYENTSTLWAFGNQGTMLSSSDLGANWQLHEKLTDSDIIASDSYSDNMVILSSEGEIFASPGNGPWIDLGSIDSADELTDITMIGEHWGGIIVIGDNGNIWKSAPSSVDDDAIEWNQTTTPWDSKLLDIAFLDNESGIIVGEEGTILYTEDGGDTWEFRESPEDARNSDLVSVGYYNPFRMFAVSSGGQILSSTTQGAINWNLVEIESHGYGTSLGRSISSIEVVSASIILFAGPSDYLSVSLDGGNIVESNMIPQGISSSFNDHAMIDYQKGIVVGDNGVILWTDSSGQNNLVGFEIPDYNNFGEFVEYSDDMLLDGFKATVKIVGFGIIFGFLIGVILAMLKTAPTTLKSLTEGRSNKIVRIIGCGLSLSGIYLFWNGLSGFSELGLNGIEYIFTPVGDPRGFASFGLGIATTFLGILFLNSNGKFSKINIGPFTFDPWKLRPLNSIATVYTDFFRNTPLIVQFMFIHFGLSLGMEAQNVYENLIGPIGNDGFDYFLLGESAFVSAICTLGLNSGAYQCETIRGAISAIPSGQMEAGRSIGLTYLGTMKLVIMPQAIRICIPPIGNEMVNLVLNSSLAMVIGYAELSRQGRLIIAVTFQIFWAWGMVMVSYFVVTWTLALLLRRLEEKTRIPGLGISGGA